MKMIRTIAAAAAVVMTMAAFGGCSEKTSETSSKDKPTAPASTEAPDVSEESSDASAEASSAGVLNFEPLKKGDKLAVLEIKGYGTIKIKLFSKAARKGVENFIGLTEMDYYNELIFHRIIPGFMMQGGDPKGTGTGGSSIWGDKFDGGIPEGLYHFTGAVAYANSGSTATNGSQFYIMNTQPGSVTDSDLDYLMHADPERYNYSQEVIDLYKEKGGYPFLDGGYTVFGQVVEGMDVVWAASAVETNENDKPLTPVVMEKVTIEEYQG